MTFTNSLRGYNPNKFIEESHVQCRQRGWNLCLGSTLVNVPQTTEQLHNSSTERRYQTTPMTAALRRFFSFLKAFVLLLTRKTTKGKAISSSLCVKETNQLIDFFCCALFVYPILTEHKEGMAKLLVLHHPLGPFYTLPPQSWSALVSKSECFWSRSRPSVKVMSGVSSHNLQLHIPIALKRSFSPFSLIKKSHLPKVNNWGVQMYISVEPTRLEALQLSVTEKYVTVIWLQNG